MSQAKSVKEVLVASRWILEHYGWHRNVKFRDKEGFACGPEDAVSFCAFGAIDIVEKELGLGLSSRSVIALQDLLPDSFALSGWNDIKAINKADVLKLFDEAIRKVSK